MKHKLPPTAFGKNEENPFEGDLLNRKQEIEDLTPVIENITSPTVMALDAPWGAGKTAFVKMWARYLNNKQIPALYFNAWETDYAPDPFMPFVEALTKQLPGNNKNLAGKAKILASAFVGDITRKFVGDETAKFANNAMEQMFDNHDQAEKFKDALENRAKAQKKERVVIFVDELDRCRPDYAIKVLERIKHLFEVPGLIFVLATNRPQLCSSVKALYGADINPDIYLRRFIDFDFTIKQPNMENFISSRLERLEVRGFLDDRKNIPGFRNGYDRLYEALTLLARKWNYSLRDAEQLLTRVVFVLQTLEDDGWGEHYFYPELLAFLVMMRLTQPDNYRKYILLTDRGTEMVAHWEVQLDTAGYKIREDGIDESRIAARITASLIMAKFQDNENQPDLHKLVDSYWNKKDSVKTYAEGRYYHELVHIIRNFDIKINLPYLVKKIEMLDKFRLLANDNAENNNG